MGFFTNFLVVTFLLAVINISLCLGNHKQEAHTIMKRMSEAGDHFEGFDVAHVMLVEGQGQSKRRLVKRDLRSIANGDNSQQLNDLQLHLSSGSQLSLALKSADIVDADTELSFITNNERVLSNLTDTDCYSYGNVKDASGEGWAAVSHCDGLFGFASSSGYEYFIHPVESKRTKRETHEEDYDVHVMWRRSASHSNDFVTKAEEMSNYISAVVEDNNEESMLTRNKRSKTNRNNKNSNQKRENYDYTSRSTKQRSFRSSDDKVVIELAMFSDAEYWSRLQRLYPGRGNKFLLTRIAAAQALYSNREKVGFDVRIKVKLVEYWITNPEGYVNNGVMGDNMHSFCAYTRFKYFYDIHALNTDIAERQDATVGLAFISGACSPLRCFVSITVGLNHFVVYAHEMGHTLGMTHFDKCPTDLQTVGGFMGGKAPLNFSPCMKSQLADFLSLKQSDCLFSETSRGATPLIYRNLPNALPGQIKSPDLMCGILAGPGYNYVRLGDFVGNGVCEWWVCLNENKTDPEFGRAKDFPVPIGFPCGEESFCVSQLKCAKWIDTTMSQTIQTLREMKEVAQWSSWSAYSSDCSRPCGTGVRIRTRRCKINGYNLSPYCQGPRFQAQLCNTEPCPGEPTFLAMQRQRRGNEVCSSFLQSNVQLKLRTANGYLPTSNELKMEDVDSNLLKVHSRSCMLKCNRDPISELGDLDAVMPDGTPCLDSQRSNRDLARFNIELRCVRGFCLEFTDCRQKLESKDACGICGGDGSRCVTLFFGREYDVPAKSRSTLVTIPKGSKNIEVRMNRATNLMVVLELWDTEYRNIIGKGGMYSDMEYAGSTAVSYAGTMWAYDRRDAFLQTSGPTKKDVVIKAFRGGNPIDSIRVAYAKPPTE